MNTEPTNSVDVIVGLGDTGLSVARYLARSGEPFKVVDSRTSPPGLAELQRTFPEAIVELGEFREATFLQARRLIVSPGISVKTGVIARAQQKGVPVTGDIDLFAKAVTVPIIAVTGSNGKSTVVAMVAEILRQAGKRFGLGGNLDGANFKPALDLLGETSKDLYLLELSSFQLETTEKLGAAVAVILNISPDHMDRYVDLGEYLQAKLRIFAGCSKRIVNRDEAGIQGVPQTREHFSFGTDQPAAGSDGSVGILDSGGQAWLAWGSDALVAVGELKVVGQHNVSNALAAMALTLAFGIDREYVIKGLREFAGLPHRCQWVASWHGVEFYNDSKGTNVGATVAAIEGLGRRLAGKIVLIAGGIGKGADFAPLHAVISRWVKAVVLIGQDAMQIARQIEGAAEYHFAGSMDEAVSEAARLADAGDAVLLSPACASFDMFNNFQHRGQVFMSTVEKLQ